MICHLGKSKLFIYLAPLTFDCLPPPWSFSHYENHSPGFVTVVGVLIIFHHPSHFSLQWSEMHFYKSVRRSQSKQLFEKASFLFQAQSFVDIDSQYTLEYGHFLFAQIFKDSLWEAYLWRSLGRCPWHLLLDQTLQLDNLDNSYSSLRIWSGFLSISQQILYQVGPVMCHTTGES